MSTHPTRLPLRSGPIGRLHEVLVDATTTTFVLPRSFGSRCWSVPTVDIGVVDLTRLVAEPRDERPDMCDPEPRIEKLWSRDQKQRSTTGLLLREPVRVPPIRATAHDRHGIGWWEARSSAGVHLDGVSLTFADPDAAHRTLVAHGAADVSDPLAWWRRQGRPIRPWDDVEHEQLGVAGRAFRRDAFVAICVLFVGGMLVALAQVLDQLWPIVPGLLIVVAARIVLLPRAHRSLARRTEQAAADARQRLSDASPGGGRTG